MFAKVYLKKNEEKRIQAGHLWIFSNEISKAEGEPANGDIVEVFDSKNNLIGKGFYNKNSLIAVRLLKFYKENFISFVKEKLTNAFKLRKHFYPERESFRFVFSESDFLPGLIIDKYNNTFVLQVYSSGIEKNIQVIVDVLLKDFNAENIFTKNDFYFRSLEGIPEEDQVYAGEIKDETIDDGLIKYKIDFSTGQKTGFYFDQVDNRFFIEKISKGMNLLDAFCNTGGFGLHAAYAGAEKVTFVDSSAAAIKTAEENYIVNNFKSKPEFINEDIFEYLKDCKEKNKLYNIINLDPPAFAKNKKSLSSAIKGYEKLNKLALELLNPSYSGTCFLSTSSCSYHLSETEFIKTINQAAVKSGKKIQLIYFNGASLDHPRLPSMPETSYLKYAVFKVDNV